MSVQVLMQPNYSIVRSEEFTLTEEEAKICVAAVHREIERHTRRFLFIFDFENVLSVSSAVWRILSTAAKEIVHNESRIAVLSNQDFERQVREHGLDHILPCYRTLHEVVDAPSPVADLNGQVLQILNAILDGTSCTIKTLAGLEAKAGHPLARGTHPNVPIEVAGSVGLLSRPFRGSLTLAFPRKTYLALLSRFFGHEVTEADAQEGGMIGELLSMVVGHGKLNLHARHYAIRRTDPVIVQGTALKVFHSEGSAAIIIPFETEIGTFFMELAGIPSDHKHK